MLKSIKFQSITRETLLKTQCNVSNCWGVSIEFEQFFKDANSNTWHIFHHKMQTIYDKKTLSNLLLAINNDELVLFQTEFEARNFYDIMNHSPFYSEVYACLISPVDGIIDENT